MCTPLSDDAWEAKLGGRWFSEEPTGDLEWSFEPHHRFAVSFNDRSGAWGYWEVRNQKLRMGTSSEEVETSEIIFAGDEVFSVRKSSGNVAEFRRASAR